jgi:hypothetical protein
MACCGWEVKNQVSIIVKRSSFASGSVGIVKSKRDTWLYPFLQSICITELIRENQCKAVSVGAGPDHFKEITAKTRA